MNEEIKSNSGSFLNVQNHPISQQSKVTSIIKRRTRDIDEDEDIGYSQSSKTQIGQIDSLIHHHQQQDKNFMKIGNSTIDMNFMNDINNECNYLITKFQQDQYVSQRMINEQRRKSGEFVNSFSKNNAAEGGSSQMVLQQEKSNKTVGPVINNSKIAAPLTSKNETRFNNRLMVDDDMNTSHINTINQKYSSSAISNCNISNKMRTADYEASNYDNRTIPEIDGNISHEKYEHDEKDSSLLANNNDKRLYENGSIVQVSSYHQENSKNSITDRQSQPEQNTLSFRDPTVNFNASGYTLPQDSKHEDKSARTHEDQSHYGVNNAQFDLQNFNAFNGQVEGVSVNSSRDFPCQDKISNTIPQKQIQKQQQYLSIKEEPYKYSQNVYSDDENQDKNESRYYKDANQIQILPNSYSLLVDNSQGNGYDHDNGQDSDYNTQLAPSHQNLKDRQQPTPSSHFNDQDIYNRLPKNFFVQQEEAKDVDMVMSSIKQMRQDFLGYVSENNIQDKLDEITNIIQPEKFFQKHFQEQASSPENMRSPVKSSRELSKRRQEEGEHEEIKFSGSGRKAYEEIQKKSNVQEIQEQMGNSILEEEVESSPDKDYADKTDKKITKDEKKKSKSCSQQASTRSMRLRSAKNVLKQPDSSDYISSNSQGPRVLKMADYFKQQQELSHVVSDKVLSCNTTVIQEDDQLSLNEDQKEQLKQRMEQDILQNIDINFLFNKGDQLRFGLIDQNKSYKLMLKIKEVASQQIEKGNKEIDFNAIVNYLKDEDLYKENDEIQPETVNNPNSMPTKMKVPSSEPCGDEQWTQVLDFMRKNPRLLIQMLPDYSEEDKKEENQQKNKNKALQQIEDAKRWAKLQALSKNFFQKRDLIEAIDNSQNYKLPQSPKSTSAKEKKTINCKGKKKTYQEKEDEQKIKKSPNNQQKQDINTSGDDTGYQSKENQKKPIQSRQQIQQKHFPYNSTTTAKLVYQNPPYIQPDLNQSQIRIATQLQTQLNQKRPLYSQQQLRGQSYTKHNKKASALSTMGDITTLGTTATGHITNLNHYQHQNIIGSQHQTIEEYSSTNQNAGIMSMLQNYNNEGQIIKGNGSQRRPTTASAAQQNNHKSLAFMRPILQQRQESVDANSVKIKKQNRLGSLSKNHQNKKTYGENSDLGNFSANNYFSQNVNQQEQFNKKTNAHNLNGSFTGAIIGPQFVPITLGPSKKTQNYIEKFAPSLKENEIHPKFMNRARRTTNQSKDSNVFHQKRLMSNDALISSLQMKEVKNRRLLDSKRTEILNQSATHIEKTQNTDSNYEQTPQGQFPKFIKRQTTSQSNSSRQDTHQNINVVPSQIQFDQQSSQKKKFVEKTMQTRIGGLNNKLLISPSSGLVDPFQNDNCSQFSVQDSQQSAKFSKKHIKMPIVDWAFTSLFSKTLNNDIEFNRDQNLSIYLEKEVDYVIDMMKNKFKEFKRSDIMRPFYLKALHTIESLLIEQGLSSLYNEMSHKYKEITIENTMKLLIRCKLCFHARTMLLDLLQSVISYELQAVDLKKIIDKHEKYLISQDNYNELHKASASVFDTGHQLLTKVKALRNVHKQFKTPFIFKKKDYVNYVRSEMNEIKKLTSIFKIQSDKQVSESQNEELKKIEENKNEEQSYYSTENNME